MTPLKAEIHFQKFTPSAPKSVKFKDTLVVGVTETKSGYKFSPSVKGWKDLQIAMTSLGSIDGFNAKRGSTSFLANQHHLGSHKNLLLVGLGEESKFSAQDFLSLGASIGLALRNCGIKAADFALESLLPAGLKIAEDRAGRKDPGGKLESTDVYERLLSGIQLGLYQFNSYKSEADKQGPLKIQILGTSITTTQAKQFVDKSKTYSEATYIARDLMNTPGNDMQPAHLAEFATKLGKKSGFSTTVWDEKRLAKEGMNGILAVGKGSKAPPRLIVMNYNASKKNAPTLVLVGKGVTFDTGGISLKPGQGMEAMKMDMGGSASVIAAMHGIAQSKAPIRVVGIVGAAENMPSGEATRPGDIYTSLSGKTVEVINTDAEGRLVLADCLTYAKTFKPTAVIDLATLTGAVIIALGGTAQAIMGNNAKLIEAFKNTSYKEGEPSWELPLFPAYIEDMRGKVADLQNIGNSRAAGSSKAGAFLGEFVDYPWLHIDIAGVMDAGAKDQGQHCPQGATGIPTRSLIEFAVDMKKKFPKA